MSARTALKPEKAGEITVPVSPPATEMPQGITSQYRFGDQRKHFLYAAPTQQPLRVSFEISVDQALLERIAARSQHNRSGKSVRGPVVAEHGRITDLGLSPSYIARIVRRAANNQNRSTVDGPLHVRVKLLEPPVPVPGVCRECKQPAMAHLREEEVKPGGYRELAPGQKYREWDHELTHVQVSFWCPGQEVPA